MYIFYVKHNSFYVGFNKSTLVVDRDDWKNHGRRLVVKSLNFFLNHLKPNDIYIYISISIYIYIYIYICRSAALTSRRYILNIYSTNIHTEYFKHAA